MELRSGKILKRESIAVKKEEELPLSPWQENLQATILNSTCPHNIMNTEFLLAESGYIPMRRRWYLYRDFHATCARLFLELGPEYSSSMHYPAGCCCIEHQTLEGFKIWLRQVGRLNLDNSREPDVIYPWTHIFREMLNAMLLRADPSEEKLLQAVNKIRVAPGAIEWMYLGNFRHCRETRESIFPTMP